MFNKYLLSAIFLGFAYNNFQIIIMNYLVNCIKLPKVTQISLLFISMANYQAFIPQTVCYKISLSCHSGVCGTSTLNIIPAVPSHLMATQCPLLPVLSMTTWRFSTCHYTPLVPLKLYTSVRCGKRFSAQLCHTGRLCPKQQFMPRPAT